MSKDSSSIPHNMSTATSSPYPHSLPHTLPPITTGPPTHLPHLSSSQPFLPPPPHSHAFTSDQLKPPLLNASLSRLNPATLTPTSAGSSISHLPLTSTPQHTMSAMNPNLSGGSTGSAGSAGYRTKNGGTSPADSKAKPHICSVCHRGFTTGGHLQRHQRIHTGVKAFKCPFPGCETRTSRQDNLQQHYRTHLSPTLRRGSGSGARAAVAAAMEAAGLKSHHTRAPRKSKGSTTGTPSSNTSASTSGHIPSPYATPTSQNGPAGTAGYMPYPVYTDHQQYGGYPTHQFPPPPGLTMTNNQSATSSRGPSPANGHSSGHSSVGSMPGAHSQPYFSQPFSPAYPYPGTMHQPPPYGRYHSMPSPYSSNQPSHHSLYSPNMNQEHAASGNMGGAAASGSGANSSNHMYSPIQTNFPPNTSHTGHSRESSFGGAAMPAYPGPSGMSNGYPPPRNSSTTSLNHAGDDRRYVSPSSRNFRRTPPSHPPPGPQTSSHPHPPPHHHEMMGHGVVDPNSMNRSTGYGGSYSSHNLSGYAYTTPTHLSGTAAGMSAGGAGGHDTLGRTGGHRQGNSISSGSDDSGASGRGESDLSGARDD